MKFIDEVEITVGSGKGGPGAVSFRREAMTPRGGPDGGDGGRGGALIFRTDSSLNTLIDFKNGRKYLAQDGHPGTGSNCSGPAGQDLILLVPVGTLIKDESGHILADLTELGDFTFLEGGRGGKGNAFFKTSVNQAPEYAQPGEAGQTLNIHLELKLIADVGIIGFPNAGKSTLISRLSSAKPKIADYPFTTLTPNLGVVKVRDFQSYVMADIPGLIKGAHEGVGLGIQFLKHIERTKVFVHVVDGSDFSGRDPIQDFKDIQFELQMYDQQNKNKEGFFPLLDRKQLVVLNKVETKSQIELDRLVKKFKSELDVVVLPISAVTGLNLKTLVQQLSDIVLAGAPQEQK